MGKLKGSKRLTLILALALSMLWVAAAGAADGPPLLPAAYYGSITSQDGSHVEVGAVEAVINGVVRSDKLIVVNDKFGGPGGLDDKLLVEGNESDKGKEVAFLVDSIPATGSTVKWTSGDVKELRLTVPYTFQGISAGSDLSLTVGNSSQLTIQSLFSNGKRETLTSNLQFESSNDNVAKVSNAGKITAVSKGTANITVSYLYHKETTVKVTVIDGSGGGGGGGGGSAEEDKSSDVSEKVNTIIDELTEGNIDSQEAAKQISQVIKDLGTSKEVSAGDQQAIRDAIGKVLELVEELPKDSTSVTASPKGQSVSVHETTLVERIEQAGRVGREMLESIDQANLPELAVAVKPNVAVVAPAGTVIDNGLAFSISKNAAEAAVENNVALKFKTEAIVFDLPAEVIKSLTNLTNDLSNLEISVKKVAEQLTSPEGNNMVGDPLDLNIAAHDGEGLEHKPASYNTKAAITISLNGVDLSQVDIRKLGVYRQVDRYNETTGQTEKVWEYVGGRISEDGKSIIFETDHTSIYAVMENKTTYSDIQKHWAKDTIEVLSAHHIVNGVAKNQFAPDAPVTRAQFTAIVLRALGIDEKTGTTQTFTDVKGDAWYAAAIETAYAEGLADGVGGGKFAPGQYISRQEMAVFIFRALKKAGNHEVVTAGQVEDLLSVFKDKDTIASWAETGVAKAVKLGIITGRTTDTLVGKANATRAESAVMVYRMLKVLGQIN